MRLKQQSQDGRRAPSHGQMYRGPPCGAESDIMLCSDDDWVSKCPSGCRLQGLISQIESDMEKKLWKVCETVKVYEDTADESMTAMTHMYNSNRKVLVSRHVSELKFVEHAEALTEKLTSLREQSLHLEQELKDLHSSVQKQVEDLYRTEVDVDMKLRTCYGSCRSARPFSVGHPSYQMLQTDMDQMDQTLNQRSKASMPPENIPHIKLQPVDVGPAPSAEYKSIPTVQRELLTQFEDLIQNQLVLEEATDVEPLY